MKPSCTLGKIHSALLIALLSTGISHAATVVSNLQEPPTSSTVFFNSTWLASSFTTDNQSYNLNSATLALDAPIGPAGVTIQVYADAAGLPGSSLGSLGTQSISSSGDKTFTSSGLSLSPNTSYWLVASADNLAVWFGTTSTAQTGSWSIGDVGQTSNDSGTTWPTSSVVGRFSIDATAVPEPGTVALSALLLGGLAARRRRKS